MKRSRIQKRIQELVERHAQALAREIAQEVTRPMLEQLAETLTKGRIPTAKITEPTPGEAAHYDPRSKHWSCPRCGTFRHIQRRAVTTHLRYCQPDESPEAPNATCEQCGKTFKNEAGLSGHLRWCGKDRKKAVIRTCIAPGCRKRSKGPRFRYLCEKHEKAPKKQVEKWRKRRAEQQQR
jgi:hypothetical protein